MTDFFEVEYEKSRPKQSDGTIYTILQCTAFARTRHKISVSAIHLQYSISNHRYTH